MFERDDIPNKSLRECENELFAGIRVEHVGESGRQRSETAETATMQNGQKLSVVKSRVGNRPIKVHRRVFTKMPGAMHYMTAAHSVLPQSRPPFEEHDGRHSICYALSKNLSINSLTFAACSCCTQCPAPSTR